MGAAAAEDSVSRKCRIEAQGQAMSDKDCQYDVSQATHKLSCKHCMNRHQTYRYYMPCLILKDMGHQMLKIVVFGNRYWSGTEEYKRIRYVPKWRVSKEKP